MGSKLFKCKSKGSPCFARFVLIGIVSLFTAHIVEAETVELSITGYWSETNFKVTSKQDKSYNPANPQFDGTVFGVAPSAGNVSLKILVNTDGSVFFPKGTDYTGGGGYLLKHDLYGYRGVSLVNDTYTFGSAVWKSNGILDGMEGPDRVKAALWTDADITKEDPTLVSFRMFGRGDGLSADFFVSSPESQAMQFLLWEYYGGESIRSSKYVVKARVLR